jgi:3-(3-hydroxy-phenyl)propionate hydroxylase
VLRPDGFIYAAAASGRPLPAPPAGLTELALTTPIRKGAFA